MLKRIARGTVDAHRAGRAAAGALAAAAGPREAELGRDDDLIAHLRQRFADEDFVLRAAVDVGRIEERYAALDGGVDHARRFVRVRGPIVTGDHHAAEAHRRNLQALRSECYRFHTAGFPPPADPDLGLAGQPVVEKAQ